MDNSNNNETLIQNDTSQAKKEKLSSSALKEQVEDEIVDRIMQQILSIK